MKTEAIHSCNKCGLCLLTCPVYQETKEETHSEFIFNRFEYLEPGLIPEAKGPGVTYHAPCHLRNAQGVGRQVETLLQALPGVRFRAVADQNACCGGGGSFFFKYPDSAKKIVSSKIDSIVRSGASVLATGCPSCRINFAGNLPGPLSVLHPVQLVADCLQGETSETGAV